MPTRRDRPGSIRSAFRSRWLTRTGGATVLALVVLSQCTPAQSQEPYHILVTNDDGWESPGLLLLVEALAQNNRVTVVAPCGQQSGSSMSFGMTRELQVIPIDVPGSVSAHCVDTRPAGTVLVAMTALAPAQPYDMVVSGINAGANVGNVSHLSGTVGAAMAAVYLGLPSVAASLAAEASSFAYPADFVARFVEDYKQRDPIPGVVLSINIPSDDPEQIQGVAVRPMGGAYLNFGYELSPEVADSSRIRIMVQPPNPYPANSDTQAYTDGWISVTPLKLDWTDMAAVEEVSTWGLTK